jgi:hypothetical protein
MEEHMAHHISHSERIKAALSAKRRRGERVGTVPPARMLWRVARGVSLAAAYRAPKSGCWAPRRRGQGEDGIRHLRKLGYLESGTEDVVPTGYDPASDEDPELARTMAASVQQRIAFGERAGQRVRRIGSGFGDDGESPILTGTRCASVNGFSLHANTHIPAHRRDELERLLRYTARGALSLERLDINADGDLLYTFTRPWSDGTTGIKLSPLELLEKLAALVPLPRLHLVRYGGCLAPHSKLRNAIIPTPRRQRVEASEGATASPNWRWARLLRYSSHSAVAAS